MGIFDAERWIKFGQGFSVYDCAFGFGNRYAFLMYEKTDTPHRDPLPRIAFLFARMERPTETRFYRATFGNFDFARLAYGEGFETEFVSVDLGGLVYSYNPPRSIEEPLHPTRAAGSDLAAVVSQIVRIGHNLYTVGGPRRMHKRKGIGQWEDMTASLSLPKDVDKPGKGLSYLWQDAAGFSEQDIYAAGGDGDVWRFDGKKFTQCSFPSNELLFNVCCASDGNVYVGGNMGSLYMGRENKWKKLSEGSFSVHWKDVAFFAGRLWCGSDYGLWELRDSKLVRADVPADVQLVSGAIDISPDGKLMLTAGPDGAALFDGQRWEVLFSRHDLE